MGNSYQKRRNTGNFPEFPEVSVSVSVSLSNIAQSSASRVFKTFHKSLLLLSRFRYTIEMMDRDDADFTAILRYRSATPYIFGNEKILEYQTMCFT